LNERLPEGSEREEERKKKMGYREVVDEGERTRKWKRRSSSGSVSS